MEEKIISGKAVIVGDNITSEIIIPEKYVEIKDQKVLGDRCFEGISEDFSPYFPTDGIIIAGKYFGRGSNRDYPCIAIMNMGAKAVIAESFSRMFYRNAVNLGLTLVECEGCTKKIKHKDIITINKDANTVKNETTGATLKTKPILTMELREKLLFSGMLKDSEQNSDEEQAESENEEEAASKKAAEESKSDKAIARFLDEQASYYDDIMLSFKKSGIKSMRQLRNEEVAISQGVSIPEPPKPDESNDTQPAEPDSSAQSETMEQSGPDKPAEIPDEKMEPDEQAEEKEAEASEPEAAAESIKTPIEASETKETTNINESDNPSEATNAVKTKDEAEDSNPAEKAEASESDNPTETDDTTESSENAIENSSTDTQAPASETKPNAVPEKQSKKQMKKKNKKKR